MIELKIILFRFLYYFKLFPIRNFKIKIIRVNEKKNKIE